MLELDNAVVSDFDDLGFYKLISFEDIHDITQPYCCRGDLGSQEVFEANKGVYISTWKYTKWIRTMPVMVWLN